jgi:hypothetical protein
MLSRESSIRKFVSSLSLKREKSSSFGLTAIFAAVTRCATHAQRNGLTLLIGEVQTCTRGVVYFAKDIRRQVTRNETNKVHVNFLFIVKLLFWVNSELATTLTHPRQSNNMKGIYVMPLPRLFLFELQLYGNRFWPTGLKIFCPKQHVELVGKNSGTVRLEISKKYCTKILWLIVPLSQIYSDCSCSHTQQKDCSRRVGLEVMKSLGTLLHRHVTGQRPELKSVLWKLFLKPLKCRGVFTEHKAFLLNSKAKDHIVWI